MNRSVLLLQSMRMWRNAGHWGVYSPQDLASMLDTRCNSAFRKFLHRQVANGTLERVAKNLYMDPVDPPNCTRILERLATRLRWPRMVYTSLESELSRLGWISQVTMGYLTVMTRGRSGTVVTRFGTIEFTHTSRSIFTLAEDLYWDTECGILRAKPHRALADLRRVGRNQHMLNEIDTKERH